MADPKRSSRTAADRTQAAYFRYVAGIARKRRCRFLGAWVVHELGLRNALAAARAQALGKDPALYRVWPQGGAPAADYTDLLQQWRRAPHPLAGLEILDQARWQWITLQPPWYRFNDDEVAAYTAQLLLQLKWRRIRTPAPHRAFGAAAGSARSPISEDHPITEVDPAGAKPAATPDPWEQRI